MSIVAAENAGLGPCDLPLSDPWVTHTAQTAGVCTLPLSSPAAATGAVAVSSAASAVPIGGSYHQSNSSNATHLQQQQAQQQSSVVLQHSPQSKIMNAVAAAVTCPTSASNRKIRRKTDNKPQSQINKCNNEKRRRELENNYIEQLGEFLQLNKRGDMTSTKPDKAAILNQVVKTYRDICDKGTNRDSTSRCTRCPTNCADTCTVHPVQQGEVSSTEPPVPESRINGQPPEISAYFEALEHYISCVGWILVQINTEGIIESCTQNIKDLIGYERSELQKQPIYSYLHTGDHNKLGPILNNMSFQLGWGEQEDQHQKNRRSITAKVRMLVKHPEGPSETMEQKQQRQDKYEEVVLIAAPIKDDGDDSSTVLCLITRPEEESPLDTNIQQHSQHRPLEQLTMKLDKSGKIIQVDSNDFRPSFALVKEVGRCVQDLCHLQDLHRLQAHLKEVQVQQHSSSFGGTLSSGPFRLRLGAPDVYVHVKANSRLFLNTTPGETDYIMSVLTVLNGHDVNPMEQHQGTVTSIGVTGSNISMVGGNHISSLPSTSHHHTSTTSVGGPLMTSVINGTVSQVQVSSRTNSVVTTFSSPPSVSESTTFFPDTFDFDFPPWEARPESRASVTPVSTSRPPSVQEYSPAPQNICSSPLTQYHTSQGAGQPSPQNNNNNTSLNNNNNNNGGFHSYNFTNFEEKEQKDHLNNNNTSSNNNHSNNGQNTSTANQNHDSERLRNLLTVKRSHANASSSGGIVDEQDSRNTHRILKGLLNTEEDKDGSGYTKHNSALTSRINASRMRTENKNSANPMLLQILNDKSDEELPDSRPNRAGSELLRQLQKDDTPKDHSTTSNNQSNQYSTDDLISLLRYQGNDYGSRKRPLNEPDDGTSAKRSDDKPSQLREKNKMLASLLANPSKAPTTLVQTPVVKIIPDIPSASRVSSSSAIGQQSPVCNQQQQMIGVQPKGAGQSQTSTNPHANQPRNIRKPSDAYLNQQMPTQPDQTKNQLILNQTQSSPSTSSVQRPQSTSFPLDSPYATSATTSSSPSLSVASSSSSKQMASSSTEPGISLVQQLQMQNECDPELSKILNDFIDFVPDITYGNPNRIDQAVGSSTPVPSQEEIERLRAITAIEKSLMQFENNTFVLSPPAYPSIVGMGAQQQNNQGFQPPPVYSQRSTRMPQMASANVRQQQYQLQRDRLLQQQQKERLLQQQQKQHMVVPESATARGDQLSLNPGMSNIGSLLNTVAPNVSLARSTLPDSQLSPGFPQNLMQQQLSPGQRGAPFSPQQGQGYQPSFPNSGQRLSPQQQQQLSQVQQQQQQQQMAFQTGTNTNAAQLSPRPPPFNVNAQSVAGSVVQSQQTQPNQQWNTLVGNARISLQQHNPMLSAQLQNVNAYNARQFQSQRRSLNSPGATVSRQNSFQGQDSGFPGPPSPSTQAPYGSANVFNNQQLQRIQRQASVPQATQHLPGSPRSFGGSDGTGGYGMMYNNMQHAAQGPPPNDFYGRTQTAGNGMNSSEYVRQELRAVVSGRTQQTTSSGGGTVVGGVNTTSTGIRTPQSPLGLTQGSMVGGNSTNSMGMATQTQPQQSTTQQQQQIPGNPHLNTSPDGIFNFELTQTDFFGGNTTR